MKNLSAKEVRRAFKAFFEERGHSVFPSASLVPVNDPTLLWINAGMAPLKPYFDGREVPANPRIVDSQKCIRTNDIENVGHTARHQTFFEMLGNFSIGDYFKREAITWAWTFLTGTLEMDAERLSVTVHFNDDEAYAIWNEEVGIPSERIVRGEEDNFWEIGEGPCGPCSEIFFDRGEEFGCGEPDCKPGCDCDRFLEIWNLVFTQFNKEADGSYTPLPKKNIDTGSGLERVASVLQNTKTNFETDLFLPIIEATADLCGQKYGEEADRDVHFKIIADHVRTVAFAIGDGVLPGNEGRNYIIRRLLRRAVRSGRRLGLNRPFLFDLAPVVSNIMGEDYPEVQEKLEFIGRVIKGEEERFHETLEEGESLLQSTIDKLRAEAKDILSGADAFRLYDTFGFPVDLTEEIAQEQGIRVDREGFAKELQAQRDRARSARHVAEGMSSDRGVLETLTEPSRFVGYGQLQTLSHVTAIVKDGKLVDALQAGEEGFLLLDETPFYAESGGQVADKGQLKAGNATAFVVAVQKAPHGQNLHTVQVQSGTLTVGAGVEASVQAEARRDTVKNHTATHLLHRALRQILGTHVAQAGSLVEPDRLRFDFSHFGPLSETELQEVERHVNQAIWQDATVDIREMGIDEAKQLGAMALFGEKYGDRVRVVKAGESIELCGGCHVERTGVIGMFRIVSETGIGSGVRRIEAVTGRGAYQFVSEREELLHQTASLLKTPVAELTGRLERYLAEVRQLEKENESLRAKLNHGRAEQLAQAVEEVSGVPVVASVVGEMDMDGLRQLMDEVRGKVPQSVIVLGGTQGDKVQLVCAVDKSLQTRGFHAGNIVKQVAAMTGGGGGGRPDVAQAGGKDVSALAGAIGQVRQIVSTLAGN